ncbi:MAG: Rpp14/Pop5 family protein [Thermoproteota archaeon]
MEWLTLMIFALFAGLVPVMWAFARALARMKRGQMLLARRVAFLEGVLRNVLAGADLEKAARELRKRRRRRYVVFQLVVEGDPPEPDEVEKAIVMQVRRLAGDVSLALGNIQLVYYDKSRKVGIIRATNDTKHVVLAALGLVRSVGGRRAVAIPLSTHGTIKRARRAAAAAQW